MLELPGYHRRPKGKNKLPSISHWGHTHQKKKLQGNHRGEKKTQNSYLKLKEQKQKKT